MDKYPCVQLFKQTQDRMLPGLLLIPPLPFLHPPSTTAVWAIVINNFTFHYAFYILMNWMPTYYDKVLGTDLSAMGSAKTLPYLTMFATSNAGGWAGDWLITRGRVGVGAARKAVNSLGFWAAAATLVCMPGAGSLGAGVALTTLALGTCGFARGGFSVNHMDIAPNFAGIVMCDGGGENTVVINDDVVCFCLSGKVALRRASSLFALCCASRGLKRMRDEEPL